MGKLFEDLKKGMQEIIAHKKGKITLKSESIEIPFFRKKVPQHPLIERTPTNSLLLVFSVTSDDGIEKIIHISYMGRLFKLANFIFHIYGIDLNGTPFEFHLLEKGARSYSGNVSFRLKQGETPLPSGIGNIQHTRIDNLLFSDKSDIVLRVEYPQPKEFILKLLRYENPEKRRKYPFVEK